MITRLGDFSERATCEIAGYVIGELMDATEEVGCLVPDIGTGAKILNEVVTRVVALPEYPTPGAMVQCMAFFNEGPTVACKRQQEIIDTMIVKVMLEKAPNILEHLKYVRATKKNDALLRIYEVAYVHSSREREFMNKCVSSYVGPLEWLHDAARMAAA